VNAACSVPWALLSGGVDFATFARQARIACQRGASGVIVGRAVWNEAITLRSDALLQFLTVTVPDRLRELAALCAEYASPWFARIVPPDDSLLWYEGY
jgi:tagatose-1,6-bisphosphate aldolase